MSLYEASYLFVEGEAILDLAKKFSTQTRKAMVQIITNKTLAEEIWNALKFPLHWRLNKVQDKWFINKLKISRILLKFPYLQRTT